MFSLILV